MQKFDTTMVPFKILQVLAIFILYLLPDIVHSSAEDSSYFFYQQPAYPRDCQEIFEQCSTNTDSGVYLIKPDGYDEAFEVYCDNHVDGGGWTVFQRRNGVNSIEFGRNVSEYQEGFGFLNGEFWLGNERLSFLTNQKRYQLHIDMTNSAGSSFNVTYDLFRISDEWSNYKITSVGQYSGTADAFIRKCPINTIFGPCACQGTCADPNGCHKRCTIEENCICPVGFLLSGSDCVTPDKCSCFVEGFGVIPRNGSYYRSECSEHCTCDDSTLTCDMNIQCNTNAICEERNNVRKCYCNEGYAGDGQSCTRIAPPTDCYEVFTSGSSDGVYTIAPTGWTGSPFEVYCNMSHGGGWTVMQRRVNRSVSFTHNWDVYKEGFGIPNHELWLGNEKLFFMTNQQNYELRIDVIKEDDVHWYMNYDLFRVDNENNNYQLKLGTYSGNAGFDYMTRHRNRQFSTPDRDNDDSSYKHCATLSNCGWWFGGGCWTADLNQVTDESFLANLHELVTFTYKPVKHTQMKIRPI